MSRVFLCSGVAAQDAVVEVPEEYVGAVVDMLGKRKGQMLDLQAAGYWLPPAPIPQPP